MDFSLQNADSKALPERPLSQESYGEYFETARVDDYSFSREDPGFLGQESPGPYDTKPEVSRTSTQPNIPPRRQSLLPSAIDDGIQGTSFTGRGVQRKLSADIRNNSGTAPAFLNDPIAEDDGNPVKSRLSELSTLSAQIDESTGSTSWLDTIDESGASSSPSAHSKESSIYLRRKRSASLSYGTEAEFDAALDAAVEAAYDEGFELANGSELAEDNDDVLGNARRNVEKAKQKVKEAEQEAEVAMTRGRDSRRDQEHDIPQNSNKSALDSLDDEAEEERLLDEMTREYVMDDFEFDLQSKSALPRLSSPSKVTSNSWENASALNTMEASGTLPPLLEDDSILGENISFQQSEPGFPTSARPASRSTPLQGVRARRISSQNTVALKIETSAHSRSDSGLLNSELSQSVDTPKDQSTPLENNQPLKSLTRRSDGNSGTTSLSSAANQAQRNASIGSVSGDISPNTNPAREVTALEYDDTAGPSKLLSPSRPHMGKVPSAPDHLSRPHPSTLPFRSRNVSVPNPEMYADSPATPSMNAFPTLDLQKGIATATVNTLPTPNAASFGSSGLPSDGLYLFDSYIHSPASPGSPNPLASNSPLQLEPCPESFLLRPFWLMRCIYQTIAHPRGGYLSTKLFIPRDVWRVKNVKIKAVEEKVSNCDLLSAALLKLSKVDTYDADAVLEEMQAFESVLDQVQMSLSKKLGSEVGVQGAMPLFKTAQAFDDTATVDALPPRTSNAPSKSYLSSWRKLRSKNSGFGAASFPNSKEASRDYLTMSSLPMTPIPNAQHANRNLAQVQFNGPNAHYMSALARLCDAAQVLGKF